MTDGAAPRGGEIDLEIDPAYTERILSGFVRAEVLRTGRERVVVGLSGGLDSSVAATIAVRALGPEAVTGMILPHETSRPDSARDAVRIAEALRIRAETADITPVVDGFVRVRGRVGRLRLGNAMARTRMMLLYDLSAALGALVLGTSNKTEILLGYGTIHGDLASAINPLGDLYKTQVRQLARYLGVPAGIRKKAPSADLWPDQSDETELGFTYEEVDRLLALLVDARVSRRAAVAAGFSPGLIDRVMQRVVGSQFKRRPPVVAKVSTRSVDWDFRYPRDWKS